MAGDIGAELVTVGREWLFAPGGRKDLRGQSLMVWSQAEQPLMDAFVDSAGDEEWIPFRLELPLLGHHQVVNGAVAFAALMVMRRQGVEIPSQAIQDGFRRVEWPGRFQIVSTDPILVVDSAHNRDSALKLRIALDDFFPGQNVLLIFGASTDKDIAGMLTELTPRISRLIVTQAVHPRAADPEEVAALARQRGIKVELAVPVAAAVRRALNIVRPDEVILAAGSLFIAGEALAAWEDSRPVRAGARTTGMVSDA
jgi:dihydrofolate synthase / folylpolyglutamate synthase